MSAHHLVGTSGGVALREFALPDMEPYRAWLHPSQDWHLWDGPYFAKPGPDEVAERVGRFSEAVASGTYAAQRPLPRAVIAREHDLDAIVGTVSWHWEDEESDWRRMGITVYDPAVRGSGIGTEALRIWTDYLFATTEVVRLDYSTWSGNTRMLGVGHRLGFTEEARFRDAREVRGARFDSIVMGVLRSEWESQALHASLA